MKKKKSWITTYFVIIVAAVLCLQLVLSFGSVEEIPPVDAAVSISGFSGGTGEPTNPYLISDVSDLRTLANHVNNGGATANTYFKLTKGIDVSGLNVQKAMVQYIILMEFLMEIIVLLQILRL